jgi:hypothetical protein
MRSSDATGKRGQERDHRRAEVVLAAVKLGERRRHHPTPAGCTRPPDTLPVGRDEALPRQLITTTAGDDDAVGGLTKNIAAIAPLDVDRAIDRRRATIMISVKQLATRKEAG